MLMQLLAQRNILASKVLFSSFKCSFDNLASVSALSPSFRVPNVTLKYRSCTRFYGMGIDNMPVQSNDNASIHPHAPRTYQVVVAATRDMGIGKDGKLPWRLPSDLKFFKELTMTTSDPGKKNAVFMGRKTWESIPLMYRPLPGRLNVVLTRSGSFSVASAENVVICGSILSALELLAEGPYGSSIEKVFVIGGGQILRETLNAPECDAIHITQIETSIECDTFIPAIDLSLFQPWYLSQPLVENNIRFSFATYVRVRNSPTGTLAASSEMECNGQGFDQLLDVVDTIKNRPDDRRVILSAWNPSDLKLMALPPCHMFAQFHVANGEISCQMYQCSGYIGVGVLLNIAFYALLPCTIAHVCAHVPGDLIHGIGDVHVNKTHVRPLQEQLQKLPKPFPILRINPKKDIASFVTSDFEMTGYDPHQKKEVKW